MALAHWRDRRTLLIFFDPACQYCREMLPGLGALEAEPTDGRPVPVIISMGALEVNRQMLEQESVRCTVLLQEEHEVATLYQVNGTPMGYLVDEQGMTASPLTVGAEALLALARSGPAMIGSVGRRTATPAVCPLPERRVNRNGLPAGSPAPAFRLPKLDGGELGLESYRGRRVLLVFSDPACEPCNVLAPQLGRIDRARADVQILMVSRGEVEANRRMAAEYDIGFPIVLQRHWEVSRAYGMLATPIAYAIDEGGVIAADVAVGGDSILALASNADGPSGGSPARTRA